MLGVQFLYDLKTGLLFTHLRELNFYVAFKIK